MLYLSFVEIRVEIYFLINKYEAIDQNGRIFNILHILSVQFFHKISSTTRLRGCQVVKLPFKEKATRCERCWAGSKFPCFAETTEIIARRADKGPVRGRGTDHHHRRPWTPATLELGSFRRWNGVEVHTQLDSWSRSVVRRVLDRGALRPSVAHCTSRGIRSRCTSNRARDLRIRHLRPCTRIARSTAPDGVNSATTLKTDAVLQTWGGDTSVIRRKESIPRGGIARRRGANVSTF